MGTSLVITSLAGGISMLTGAIVEFSVGNANLSVSRKLEKAEIVYDKAETIVNELAQEPTVSKLKIRGLKSEIEEGKAIADDTELEIEEDLDHYVESEL